MEGSLTFYLNDEKHPLKAGELMIINSNEVHSIDSPEENHTAVLQIPLKQFEDYFTAHRFVRFAGSVPEMDATLWRLVREMYKLYGKRGVGYEFKIRSFYYDVLYFWSITTGWTRRASRKYATAAAWMLLRELLPI